MDPGTIDQGFTVFICSDVYYIVTYVSDYGQEYGLEVGFIDHFNTWLVTTLNYITITDLHILQITTAQAKSFQSAVFSPVIPL
jgi:hypothetical protein